MVPDAVENQVVATPSVGEILLGVINDMICADRSNHVDIPCAAHAGHLYAKGLGDLNGERTHASRRTINQDLLPRLNLSLAKSLQCGECRHRYRSRLLKGHVIRFHNQCRLGSTRILSEGPLAPAE